MPARPAMARVAPVRVVLASAPPAMADEVRQLDSVATGWRETTLPAEASLAAACDTADGIVVRPSIERTHFGSNVDDRNLLFIYETSIVVGIPVTLVSLVAWPWYGETAVAGRLEVVPCDGSPPPAPILESFRIRSEGRGLISRDRLQAEQGDIAIRGVTRKLFGAPTLQNQRGDHPS